MKLFEVEWQINSFSYGLSTSYLSNPGKNKKAFASKDKAEEFYKKLYEAAGILNITGLMEARIHEVEIE